MRGTDNFGKIYTKTIRTSSAVTIAANAQSRIDFANALDSGETFLGLVGWDGNNVNQTSMAANLYNASSNTFQVWVGNLTSTSKTMNYYQVTLLVKGGE